MGCYIFPPFSLISRILAKVRRDKAVAILIAPVWPTQGWYPVLLHYLVQLPVLLPQWEDLLVRPHNQEFHPLRFKMRPAAWVVSGNLSQTREFLLKLPTLSVQAGQQVQKKQYQVVWKKWRGWCRERNVDSLQAHVSQVLNFLADCFGEGLSYSTLNSYRSALSSTLCPRDGTTVGCDPLVSTIPDKKVGTPSKFSPPPTYNVDNRVIFSLFVGKNAIFSNID